jgi:DNA repair protein RadA/Sms
VRPVPHAAARLKEAQKLGFARATLPETKDATGTQGTTVTALAELVAAIAATARARD